MKDFRRKTKTGKSCVQESIRRAKIYIMDNGGFCYKKRGGKTGEKEKKRTDFWFFSNQLKEFGVTVFFLFFSLSFFQHEEFLHMVGGLRN